MIFTGGFSDDAEWKVCDYLSYSVPVWPISPHSHAHVHIIGGGDTRVPLRLHRPKARQGSAHQGLRGVQGRRNLAFQRRRQGSLFVYDFVCVHARAHVNHTNAQCVHAGRHRQVRTHAHTRSHTHARTQVQANVGKWMDGTILKQWDEGNPYRIELADGTNVWGPIDDDTFVRAKK